MTPVDAATVRRRLLAMGELVGHLKGIGQPSSADLESDLGLRLQVSMALAQLITLAAEINAHVVTRVTGAAPLDMRDSFMRMAAAGWIDRELAQELRRSPGLRNVLLHEYVRVDLDIVAAAVPRAVEQYGQYVREVAHHLPSE